MRSGPNKTRAWRKISREFNPETGRIERYGRRFKNAMIQLPKGAGVHPIVFWLMKAGGIATTVFDSSRKASDNNVSDVTTIEENTIAVV